MPVLIQAIEEVKPVLVILDPLVAYLGDIDMHRSNQTRPLMSALKTVAEQYACSILGVRHPAKTDQGGRLMYRGQGNMDIIGAARSGLWVQPHPTHPETHTIMLQSKTNVGKLGRTIIFSREEGTFAWHGVSRLTEAMLTGTAHVRRSFTPVRMEADLIASRVPLAVPPLALSCMTAFVRCAT